MTIDPYWYLVFGGLGLQGGSRDLRGAFRDEVEARSAFHELREENKRAGGWGEVVRVDSKGRTRQVCWFGPRGTGGPDPVPPAPFRRWRRR